MATILCLTGDVPGTLWAGVELSRRLARAGHRVVYGSSADARRTAENNGLEFLELDASGYQDFLAADARSTVWSRLRRTRDRRRAAIESLALDGVQRAIRRHTPDLVIIDCELHEQVVAARAAGAPVALLSSFVSIWRHPDLPPPHHLARPGIGFKGSRLGRWLLWRELRLRKWRRAWLLRIQRIGCDRLSLLHRLARDGDFDLRREIDASQWLMPFTWRNLPLLAAHALEFEFPHRPPTGVHFVGPLVLADRGELETDEKKSRHAELQKIFREARDMGRKLVYAGFGSYLSTDIGLLRRLLAAVEKRRDWELVLSLGGRMRPAALGPQMERIHVFPWVPQPQLLRHADVAVIHGGVNTVDECVLAGVPMLVYCGFETDMAGTTSRLVHHGLGIAGDRRRDDAGAVGRHIDRLLRESSFRRQIERLRSRYLAYGENRVAEGIVESLLAASRPESGV